MKYSKKSKFLTFTALLLCIFTIVSSATDFGVVCAQTSLNLRSAPNTSSNILASMPNGYKVNILGIENNFYKVTYNSITGYASCDYISVITQDSSPIAAAQTQVGIAEASGGLNLRSAPDTGASKLAVIPSGSKIDITATEGSWYKVTYLGNVGYVYSSYVRLASDISDRSSTLTREAQDEASQLLSYAKGFLGVPYVYGGESPKGFDCSGYVKYIFAHFGYDLPRTATEQQQSSLGVTVSKSELMPGDIVFFKQPSSSKPIGHSGIYVGDGKFIHASSPGDVVKYDSIYSSYYSTNYVTARRIIK